MDINNKSRFFLLEMSNNQDFQTEDYQELVKKLISEDYYDLSKAERHEKIKNVATANVAFKNLGFQKQGSDERLEVRDSYSKGDDLSNGIYTCDDKSYILSLASTNIIMLFERADSNIIMKNVRPRCYEAEYCVINTHAKDLLRNHLNKQLNDRER